MFTDSSLIVIGAFIIFILVSIGAVIVLWAAVPFSVFGVKDLLKNMIAEQEKTNALLREMAGSDCFKEGRHKDDAQEKPENLH
ncbi:MAG: hypothetical protein AABY45_05715 [Deltaproteobacteria bacterium]